MEEEEEEADFEERRLDTEEDQKAESPEHGGVTSCQPDRDVGETEDLASSATAASETSPATNTPADAAVGGAETTQRR